MTRIFGDIRLLVIASLCAFSATLAHAQPYPNKPVRVIVPFPPGGVLDAAVRTTTQRLQASMGQPFVVENMPGASGNIGLSTCARAPADGYTICVTTNDTISINPFLFAKMPLDPRELVPVQRLVWIDGVIFAPTSAPYSTLPELIATAKSKPGAIAWGSFGTGSTGHLYMSWLNKERGIELLHVPYKGSAPLVQAVLGGEVQAGMLATGILSQHIKSGKIKPIAVVGNKRLDSMPNVPTVAESGVDFYIPSWFGIFAPAGTPKDIVERLNAETAKVINAPAFATDVLTPQGFRAATTSTADFAKFLKDDRAAGEKLVKIADVKLD